MATCEYRKIVNSGGSDRFVLGGSSMVRSVSLGTWTQIRVGIRVGVAGLYALGPRNLVFNPNLALGFCSGTANHYSEDSTTHFVGIYGSDVWEYAGSDALYGMTITPVKRVGTTITTGTNIATSFCGYIRADSSPKWSMIFVELNYGSPNYTLKSFYRNGSGAYSVTETDFKTAMLSAAPALTNHTFPAGQTLAVNEGADGVLNAINIYWGAPNRLFHIEEVAVARLA